MLGTLSYGGMASQVTLVDTTHYGVPQTVISFVRDDMKNTKILSADERLLYTVETDKETNARTAVYRADTREAVAVLKRKELRADRIQFGQAPSVKLSGWLRGAGGKCPVTFEWNGTKYTWKANDARQIALYDESDPVAPIAWFQTSHREVIDGVTTINRALVALQDTAQPVLDAIVVSLLVVEHGLRVKEMKYRNAESGMPTFKHSI